MQLGNAISRVFQFIFVPIVLGLSIHLVIQQYSGMSPAQTNFSVACGVIGALALLVGIAGLFIDALTIPVLVLDGLSTLFFLAGGIAMAVALGVHDCDGNRPPNYPRGAPNPYCATNKIIAGGAIILNSKEFRWLENNNWFVSRCQTAKALDAFMFFSLVAFASSLVFTLIGSRKGGSSYA